MLSFLRACVLACLLVEPAFAQQALQFSQLEGWWRSPLEHNGQASEMFLHFVTDNGKPAVRLSAPELGAWDFPFGGVEIAGNRVTLPAVKMPLTFDAASGTLSGKLPEGLVPVYEIPLAFKRIDPPSAPRAVAWNVPQPQVAWTHEAGSPVWAGLALDEGTNLLYVATDSGSVQAIDARAGALLWLVDTLGSIRAQPTPDDGFVYVASDDGYLYKFDGLRGTERWRIRIDSGKEPRKPRGTREARFDRYGSGAAVDSGRVYVGSRDGNLYALDAESGRELWRASARDMITATPLVRGDEVIFASFDNNVYAVGAADGKPLWQRDLRGAIATDLAIAGNRLLVGTRAYDLHALDVDSGAPLWSYYYWFSWVDSGPNVQDDIAYVGSSDIANVFAFDTKSGALKWRSRLNGWCWPRPAVSGKHVYAAMVGGDAGFATMRGALVALNRRNGALEWAYELPKPDPLRQFGFAASPVATRDRVYAADLAGRVYAFSTRIKTDRKRENIGIGVRAVEPPPRKKKD